MTAPRRYTLKYGNPGRGVPPLSIGRVQTPTLALVVRRGLEIEHFKPEPYWVLTTKYREVVFTAQPAGKQTEAAAENANGETSAAADRRMAFTSEEEGRAALERVKAAPFTVNDVSRKNGTEAPPRLFDLTALQVEGNKKFG